MGYPGFEHEVNLLKLHARPVVDPPPMFTADVILGLQAKLPNVFARESLFHYIVELAEASREHPDLALGASPRAALNLLRCARARSVLRGRHFVTHEDVQAVAFGVLAHRLIMRPEAEIEGRDVTDVVKDVLAQVKVLETV
jgi:MoxR-like ATPase